MSIVGTKKKHLLPRYGLFLPQIMKEDIPYLTKPSPRYTRSQVMKAAKLHRKKGFPVKIMRLD